MVRREFTECRSTLKSCQPIHFQCVTFSVLPSQRSARRVSISVSRLCFTTPLIRILIPLTSFSSLHLSQRLSLMAADGSILRQVLVALLALLFDVVAQHEYQNALLLPHLKLCCIWSRLRQRLTIRQKSSVVLESGPCVTMKRFRSKRPVTQFA